MTEDDKPESFKCPNCRVLLAIAYCGRYPSALVMISQPTLGSKIRDILAPVIWGRDVPYSEAKRIEDHLVRAIEHLFEDMKERERKR